MNNENFWRLFDHMRRLAAARFDHADWWDECDCGSVGCIAGHAAALAGHNPVRFAHMSRVTFACCAQERWFSWWLHIPIQDSHTICNPTSAAKSLGRPIETPQDAAHLLLHVCRKYLPSDEVERAEAELEDATC